MSAIDFWAASLPRQARLLAATSVAFCVPDVFRSRRECVMATPQDPIDHTFSIIVLSAAASGKWLSISTVSTA